MRLTRTTIMFNAGLVTLSDLEEFVAEAKKLGMSSDDEFDIERDRFDEIAGIYWEG